VLEQVLVDDEIEELLKFTPKLTPVKNQLKTNNIVHIINSPIGKWSIEKCDDISSYNNKSGSMLVKKKLFVDKTKGNKSGI